MKIDCRIKDDGVFQSLKLKMFPMKLRAKGLDSKLTLF